MLSIITITYNNLNGLKKTHQSIEKQTSDNFEWIIIDGASTDGTAAYLHETEANFIREADNGIYDAMNKGIKHATGSHIIFMNAGDAFATPDTLKEIEALIQHDNPDFIYGDSIEANQKRHFTKKARSHTKIHQGMFTHHQAMIYASTLFENLQYDEQYEITADYDLTLRALPNASKISYLPKPICIFEAGGISQQKVKQGRKEQFQIRKEFGVPDLENKMTYIAQTLVYNLRRFTPGLYWLLKRF